MVLGIVSDASLYNQIATLNFRGDYDIRQIPIQTRTVLEIWKSIEGEQPYTHILLDINYPKATTDTILTLLSRFMQTTNYQWLILANGYMPDSRLFRDLLSLDIKKENIFLQAGSSMKARISLLLQQELSLNAETDQPRPETIIECPKASISSTITELDTPIVPPSQIDLAAGKAMQIHKPIRPSSRAVTIAFAGGGSRIGTTTQAMQLILFLKSKGFHCVYIDMASSEKIDQLFDVYESAERINNNEVLIQNINLITNPKLLMQARCEYDYVICDYGAYESIIEPVSYWEKDIKIMVAGTKPWESRYLPDIFNDDDGSLKYIFSFVPHSDESAVRQQMAESASKTYFASYSPDYFVYCGTDELYSSLIDCPTTNAPTQKEKGFHFFFNRRKKL